ncbi:GATA zinc finger domain-containing protein 14-like isoform X2 [Sipha flava]|uniref:GATA zinc finger domain-containing protein 14-like isoform X2 n=1 Tax=Sipha flava TaxID=143950 RepID=A0A8B8GBK4_9HEMI|nr:GATA zinc finger domain-containing protein 14-like isoform X2 [Sipha flava]
MNTDMKSSNETNILNVNKENCLTLNEINQNENILNVKTTSEIMYSEMKSSNETNISNVEYEEATTSNKEDNLQFLDNLQHSNNLVDNISKSNHFEKVAITLKTEEHSKFNNQPDNIKIDGFISTNSSCEVQKIFKIKKYNTLYTSLLSIVEESCSEINSNSEKHSIDEKKHSHEEVTTSVLQMKLNDHEPVNPKDGFLIDDSSCKIDATIKQTESYPTEITNTNLTTKESFLENNLEKESTSLNSDNDHYDIEVTTSEPVEQLMLNNQDDFINAKGICIIHESSDLRLEKNKEDNKHLTDEVSTSISEQQFMLPFNDKNLENIPVDEISSCEVYKTSNVKKNYSSGSNENFVTEDLYPIKKQDDKRYSKNVKSNQNDVEVTTTKSEEHLQLNIQQEFANSKDSFDSVESIGEVHSNSKLKTTNPSNTSVLLITTDTSHSEMNLTDERHSTDENDNFEDGETISVQGEQFNLNDIQDFIKTDSSVNDESSYDALNNSNFKNCNPSTKNVIIGTDGVMIDNLNEEVTTSISEEQLMLENEDIFVDSRSTSVHNKPTYEEYNDLNLKKCNSLETTNTNITIEEPYPKTYLEDDRCSIEVENNYFEEEVTTSSKPEEHSIMEGQQQDFNNSKDFSIGESNGDKSCCVLNRILGLYNNGPCRISSVTAIVTPMPDHEKNLDSNERDTINETNSSGNTSLIVRTELLNNDQISNNCEKNSTHNENTNGPNSKFCIKLENVIDPENNTFNKPDCGLSGTSKLKPNNNMSRNVSLIVTTAAPSKTNNLDDAERNSNDEEKKKRKKSNVSIKLENETGEHPFIISEGSLVDKSINSGIASSSTSVGVKNKIIKNYEKEGGFNNKKLKASSSKSTTESYNKNKNQNHKENDHIEKISSFTSTFKKKTNNHKEKNKGDDSIKKSHKKHKKNKSKDVDISFGDLDISVAENQFSELSLFSF